MPDLDTPEEIAELVRRFSAVVARDELLGPMFTDVAEVDWSEHLPRMTAFWRRALLGEVGYEGNPFRAHARIHARQPFTTAHFERWLSLFGDAISAWSGPTTDRALEMVADVARVHSRQLTGEEVSIVGALGRSSADSVISTDSVIIDIRVEPADRRPTDGDPGPDGDRVTLP